MKFNFNLNTQYFSQLRCIRMDCDDGLITSAFPSLSLHCTSIPTSPAIILPLSILPFGVSFIDLPNNNAATTPLFNTPTPFLYIHISTFCPSVIYLSLQILLLCLSLRLSFFAFLWLHTVMVAGAFPTLLSTNSVSSLMLESTYALTPTTP